MFCFMSSAMFFDEIPSCLTVKMGMLQKSTDFKIFKLVYLSVYDQVSPAKLACGCLK